MQKVQRVLRNEENSKMRPDRPRSAQIAAGNYAK